jgi:integrase
MLIQFTEPKIVSSGDLNTRSYVTFYFNNKRVREYNGKSLNLTINPNRAVNTSDRDRLLKKLQFELHKALEASAYPYVEVIKEAIVKEEPRPTAEYLLKEALTKKLNADLSKTYKRNLRLIHNQFTSFLSQQELQSDITSISTLRIEEFLSRFQSSGTYYMDRRRDLGVLFTSVGKMIDQTVNSVKKTESRRIKAKLHKAYEKQQLKPIFEFLKKNHYNLYLCCLFTYGSWLRPHEEVRLLTKEHFKMDNSEIHLSGGENKGGRVRVVYVPNYIQEVINPILNKINREDNIFSLSTKPFNDAYFNTQWKRVWDRMYEQGLVFKNQTIYSFRHTAAVEVYKRTKDVYLLQKLLGHSSITVTLKYLRSLGEFNSEELRDAAPQLD